MGLALEVQPKTPPSYPPMLMQYLEYKDRYPDCLLFFQVGDFFELFFEDAKTVAKVINLTLTSRDKNNPNPVPMCGVPIGVADTYAERLVSNGYSVALVRQCEAPTGKGMVARKLDRIITPGIRVLGAVDADSSDALVVAVQIVGQADVALAFSNIQSGRVEVREGIALDSLVQEISRLSPSEVILPRTVGGKAIDRRVSWVKALESVVKFGNIKFRSDQEVGARPSRPEVLEISGFKTLSPTGKRAVSFLISFIDEITVDASLQIGSIEAKTYEDIVSIDATTRTNLELVKNAKDATTRGTLFEYLRTTITPGGERLLREWLLHPLMNIGKIRWRQDIVKEFVTVQSLVEDLRSEMEGFPDIERIATRLELGIVAPRELGALRDSLLKAPHLLSQLEGLGAAVVFNGLAWSDLSLGAETLSKALVDVPPLSSNDGGIFRAGFNEDLDRLSLVSEKGKEWIAELELKEKNSTGIGSLKIRYNNVFGYFIEITHANLSKVPPHYIRKQTTSNSERFITEELKVREEEVLGASDKKIILERKFFDELRHSILPLVFELRNLSLCLSTLDILLSFAHNALNKNLICPELSETQRLEIVKGKHPQLAALLGGSFIPNSLEIDAVERGCIILTGPNMGGKSTYLRQSALIVILAQIGAFVPAERAHIGIVDKIFARLGASDDITEGESTFMVEMREASFIVRNATHRSLLLIDEIGRGTATADGLAIARAILEWIVLKTKARTLFATHFHELTLLSDIYPIGIQNFSVGSLEKNGQVIFTHEIKKGPANKSYGIEVAKLAGLPPELLTRASEILEALSVESDAKAKGGHASVRQLSIFESIIDPHPAQPLPSKIEKSYDEIIKAIDECDINGTTPLQALSILSELKGKLLLMVDSKK